MIIFGIGIEGNDGGNNEWIYRKFALGLQQIQEGEAREWSSSQLWLISVSQINNIKITNYIILEHYLKSISELNKVWNITKIYIYIYIYYR